MQWHEVLTAVRALLAAELPGTLIAWQNENFTAPYGDPWIYAELLPVTASSSHFSSPGLRIYSAQGLIAAHVFVMTGTGAGAAFALAEQLGQILQLRTISPGVETGGYEVSGATSADDEGNYFRVGVTVPLAINTTH
jgi:hypothetical protein